MDLDVYIKLSLKPFLSLCDIYNNRRKNLNNGIKPNIYIAHYALVELE